MMNKTQTGSSGLITANKGEWSEVYVFFKLLAEGKLYSADNELNRTELFYPIISIIRDEIGDAEKEYSYANAERSIVVVSKANAELTRLPVNEFLTQAKKMYVEIPKGSGAFSIADVQAFLERIHCDSVKASSQGKSDIRIVLHDYHTNSEGMFGFSIKSGLGGAPTLLNASAATSFNFEIVGSGTPNAEFVERVNSIEGRTKYQDRINAIYEEGYSLKYSGMPNGVFESNLRMIDSLLPEILGWMMVDSYRNRDSCLDGCLHRIADANPFGFRSSSVENMYSYKLRSLLVAVALGMMPAQEWSGRYDATGGYIVAKSDGDVVCFHIFDRNVLEDHLLSNTKFETPSGSRYGICQLRQEGSRVFLSLTLQLRFKKA